MNAPILILALAALKAKLEGLRGEVRTTEAEIQRIKAASVERPPPPRMARDIYKARRHRDRYFDAKLFGEPAWDILLDLFASAEAGKEVAVSSLCIAAAVPATTALRWIGHLEEAELVVRASDPRDGRRVMIALTDDARWRLTCYLSEIADQYAGSISMAIET